MIENEEIPSKPAPQTPRPSAAKATNYLLILTILSLGMFGFAYANAQWFVLICQEVGLLTKPAVASRGEAEAGAIGRPLEVYFTAAANDNIPIAFSARESYQKTNVGKVRRNEYTFVNLSNERIYFKPVHDVSPLLKNLDDVLTLQKCFCFEQQMIEPKQTYTLPVEYVFNEKLDPSIDVISMRYSLFPSTKADYEASQAASAADKAKLSRNQGAQTP